jgi:hypothetical protein
MDPLSTFFLAVIALCTLVNALFFAALAVGALMATAKVDELAVRAERDWPQVREKIEKATAQAVALTSMARVAALRAESTADSFAAASERASTIARKVASPVKNAIALTHAVRRAVGIYKAQA